MDKNEILKMTHNEYMEFLKKNAERLYNEKGYTMAHFNQDAERVEIIGFHLEQFGFSDKQRTFIDKVFSGDREDRFGNMLLEGHVGDRAPVFTIARELGCELVTDKCYNGFFKNDEKRCVFEFCEGDIYLALCETDQKYQEAVESYNQFYEVTPRKINLIDLMCYLEENGWRIEPYSARDTEPVCDAGWEVSKETPEAHDFFFFVDHGDDPKRVVAGIKKIARDFDFNAYAQENSTKWGAPSMDRLIRDAKWIKRHLDALADGVVGLCPDYQGSLEEQIRVCEGMSKKDGKGTVEREFGER